MSAKAAPSQPEPAGILRDASLNTLPARQEARRAELYAAALEYIGLGIAVFPLSHVKADRELLGGRDAALQVQGQPGARR